MKKNKFLSFIFNNRSSKYGFTLIELLVVIGIIAILIGFAVANFVGARERAMDSKVKAEMRELKNALRLYYNDFQKYPNKCAANFTIDTVTYSSNFIKGCSSDGDTCCGATGAWACSGGGFASGPTGCDTVYMKKLPTSLGRTILYFGNGENFCLKTVTTLNNPSDPDVAANQLRCSASCTAAGSSCTALSKAYCECED
jgi:prepilin-type N-terminal cleavage/methylation domain-containing protein